MYIYLTVSFRGRQFTSKFPLQPFAKQVTELRYSESRLWLYTTVDDMSKDTKALQYIYAPPVLCDYANMKKASG